MSRQIVITLPEWTEIKQIDNKQFADLLPAYDEMLNMIKNGTPLPKGHGRIADMDEAIKCIEEVEGEDAIWAISLIEWACGKRTLIEADRTESEEK